MKIVMVTCYDATFAKLCAETQAVDYLLVGDSLGMVIQGHSNTLAVTLDHVAYHTKAVKAGLESAQSSSSVQVIADLPVDTYNTPAQAVESSRRLIEAGADMVKLEGPQAKAIEALRQAGIRVCGHIGLTPQTILDYKVQGKSQEDAHRLRNEALEIQAAGAEMIVFEMIPAALAETLTRDLKIPTIGIGAGAGCSGQVLVLYDLLGLNDSFSPKFLKKFAKGSQMIREALKSYSQEVRAGTYPSEEHSFRS